MLAAVLIGVAALRPVPPPKDRPITIPEDQPLRLTVLGTSLSHGETWPALLEDRLATCRTRPATVTVIARPGATVTWGLSRIAAVAATEPNVVLVEFAINDADLRDGHSLNLARRWHGQLVADLRAALPEAAIFLMTMSPAEGLRGLVRPRLRAHYRQYRALADTHDLGLVDLYPRWRALPRAERGLGGDGLHPDPVVAAKIIVPAVAGILGGPDCV